MFLLLSCCVCWERENMNGEREKNNKILLYTVTVASV